MTVKIEELTIEIVKKEIFNMLQHNSQADEMEYFNFSKRSFKELKELFPGKNPLIELDSIIKQIKNVITEINEYGGIKQVENDLKWFRIQYKTKGYDPTGYRGIDWDTYGKLDREDLTDMKYLESLYIYK